MTDYSDYITFNGSLQAKYEAGIAAGNRQNVFTKIGDSISYWQSFLGPVGLRWSVGLTAAQQAVVRYFSAATARISNSWLNPSIAAIRGTRIADLNAAYSAGTQTYKYHSSLVTLADTPVANECAIVEPLFAIVMTGTVDVGGTLTATFSSGVQTLLTTLMGLGVIPIMSTIPRRTDAAIDVSSYNAALMTLATSNGLPIMDLYGVLEGLPAYGLSVDGIHPSMPTPFPNTADFSESGLTYGYNARNLLAIEALRLVLTEVNPGALS